MEARFERGLLRAAQPELTAAEQQLALADLATPVPAPSVLAGIELLFGRAEKLRLERRFAEAMALLQEVLAYDATHVPARTALARVALALGDDNLARNYAASAVDLQQGYGPIYLARERHMLPTTILGLGAALVDFAGELVDGPDNTLALAYRGLVQLRRALRLLGEGHRSEALAAVSAAIEDHDAAIRLHPAIAGALNNLAVCLMQADRVLTMGGDSAGAVAARARAENDLAQALARAPELPEAHFSAGLVALRNAGLLRLLGRGPAAARRFDAARQSLQRALAAAPRGWLHEPACRARLADADAGSRAGG